MKRFTRKLTRQPENNGMRLIPQGELPLTRTMRDLFPGLVVECDRPPRDEPLCDIASREGAYIGGAAGTRSDIEQALDEWGWLKRRRNTTSKGDTNEPQNEDPRQIKVEC